jgi:hypothetical protein
LIVSDHTIQGRKKMVELSSKFSRPDIETLIDALGDWELVGTQDYSLLQMIESSPMPPEDHEAYEMVVQVKEHYRNRKKDILASRAIRQEKAIFLKAKLLLVRNGMEIEDLFEMEPDPTVPAQIPVQATVPVTTGLSLELAEYFIRDLGVWDHYQKFLAEKSEK